MAKYKIIIQKYTPAVDAKYARTESIYEQCTDNEIDLMPIIVAFNQQKPNQVDKTVQA